MTMPLPDGLREAHASQRSAWRSNASPLSVLILGAILLAAVLGAFGGGRDDVFEARANGIGLRVETPGIIRNGEFFETRIRIETSRRIGKLVIGVSPALWRETTVNTIMPQAADEEYAGGYFRYTYGPGEPGETRIVKLDGQVNPSLRGTLSGDIAVFDGATRLVAVPLAIEVRP